MNDENIPASERTDKVSTYPVVASWLALKWICPLCLKVNNITEATARLNSMSDECVNCETAVNLMEPVP